MSFDDDGYGSRPMRRPRRGDPPTQSLNEAVNGVAVSTAPAHSLDERALEAEGRSVALLGVETELGRQNHHGTLVPRNRLTTDKANRVLQAMKDWQPPEQALLSNGINKETLLKYRRLAEDPEAHPIYNVFISEYDRFSGELVGAIIRNGNDVANVSKDTGWHRYLASIWSPAARQKMQIEVDHQVTIQLQALLVALESELAPEVFIRVLEIAHSLQPSRGTFSQTPK